MRKINHSLSAKLSLSILLLSVPIFFLALSIEFIHSRELLRQEATEHAASILHTTTMRVRNYMNTVETAANANAWLVEENFQPEAIKATCHRIVSLNHSVHDCTISTEPDAFPEYGHTFSVQTVNTGDTVLTTCTNDRDYFDESWYRTPLKTKNACWIDPIEEVEGSTLSNQMVIATYCRPLTAKDGRTLGVMTTNISFEQLAAAINAAERPYPNSYYLFIGGDGRYVIYPDSARLCKKNVYGESSQEYSKLDALDHKMTAGHQATLHTTIGGNFAHVCYAPIPDTNWSLALISPDNEVLSNYHQLVNIIVVLIIIGLIVILWLCYHVVHQTIRPINKLLTLSEKIVDGNYDESIPYSPREDAIGKLQNSFSIMQQSLHKYMGSIRMKAKEAQLRNTELVEAMKLAEEGVRKKEVFIQNVSHQMRTPLNIILGFADVLRDSLLARDNGQDTLKEEELANITNTMKYNSMHLNRMVLMLFDSSEQGAGGKIFNLRKEDVSCNAAAREAIDYAQTHFPQQTVHFETALPDNFRILTNELYLTHILGELLYNAGKFSNGEHTSLHISDTPTSVIFTIEDQGPGLPLGQEDTIFKPFAKVDDLSEGLGLGLPLAKRHALNLDGDLYYDATYHDGCRFIVEMPK
jgi:signal transduction histidine kinase